MFNIDNILVIFDYNTNGVYYMAIIIIKLCGNSLYYSISFVMVQLLNNLCSFGLGISYIILCYFRIDFITFRY